MIINGDSFQELKKLEDASVDSIVTDPPYDIGFMNKKWDKKSLITNVEFWKECMRVLKPGGHLLAFGHSRTSHRMVTAVEDAGFEIRDTIMWMYGSGFPKSHNVAIAIDKKLGKMGHRGKRASFNGERAILDKDMPAAVGVEQHQAISDEAKEWQGWGTALKPAYEPVVMARKPLGEKSVAENVMKWGTGGINIDECRIGEEKIITNGKGNKFVENNPHGQRTGESVLGVNKENVGRFPANVILDSEAGELLDEQAPKVGNGHRAKTKITGYGKNYGGTQEYDGPGEKLDGLGGASRFFHKVEAEPQGRFPANVILDEEAGQLLDEQSGFSKTTANKNYKHDKTACEGNTFTNRGTYTPREDSGGASRFFYCAKVATRERKLEEGKNNHPTVKPVKLMEYLVKLVTRKGGVVLDPFAGSGSTGVAAKNLGMNYILIEREPEYCEIIRARLKE